jgi:hypothetical protein
MNYDFDKLLAENKRLRASNAALLEALEGLLAAEGPYYQGSEDDDARDKARAAIAAARGKK